MRPGRLFVPSACAVVLFVASGAQAQTTWHVDGDSPYDGPGNGWEHAYHFLQNALAVAGAGDEIHVAEGIYRPDETTANPNGTGDRTATFHLISGVEIYGGYAGYGQPDPDERDLDTYFSTLSGDLAENDGPGAFDNNDENSYHVTTGSGTDDTAVLDGFTITRGKADGSGPLGKGAGMYNYGGEPELNNCEFNNNEAWDNGGGMFHDGGDPELNNCKFSNNEAWGNGAGMCSSGNPRLTGCTFSNNYAWGGGGGMYSNGNPSLAGCKFNANDSESWIDGGGGMWSSGDPMLTDCRFSSNAAYGSYSGGGGIDSRGNATFTNCMFEFNMAWDRGGGMVINGSATLLDCRFDGNDALEGGGGMCGGNLTMIDCTFIGNGAIQGEGGGVSGGVTAINCDFVGNDGAYYGGGVAGTALLINCVFLDNTADEGGGVGGGGYVENCVFAGNRAAWLGGGGMYGDGTVINCTFSGNWADCSDGGGIYGSGTVTNCTFNGNRADGDGGGVYSSGTPTLTNCVFWENSDVGGTDESAQVQVVSGTPDIKYSCVQGWTGGWGGTGNIGDDPLFVGWPDNGTWTSAGQYDWDTYQTTLTDGTQAWFVDELVGKLVNPDITYPLQFVIIANTANTITVWGSPWNMPQAGDTYRIHDYHVQEGSPCVNAGDPDFVPGPSETDIDGEERVQQCRVDMGADETPYFNKDCNQNGAADACDIAVGTSTDFDGGGIPDECEPTADIKPGACPNSFNRSGHGVLPVALLGGLYFDVTEIDISAVRLSRADGVGEPVAPHEGPPGPHSEQEDVGTPFYGEMCDCHDAAGDGMFDLFVKFKSDNVVASLLLDELNPGALVELMVTGSLIDGTAFAARDCVRLVPPGTPPGMVVVQSNAAGAWIDASPLDLQLDGGGFANFERTYPLGSVVRFTAEQTYEGKRFICWHLDGEFYSTDLSIDVTTTDDVHALEAVMLWPGDMDGDADVDLSDFAEFALCYGGASVTVPPPGCAPCEFRGADLDDDNDVDLADFATFALDYTG